MKSRSDNNENVGLDNNSPELHDLIEESRKIYTTRDTIACPFFNGPVTLNSDGFNHLLYKPNRQPRNIKEQRLKLQLLKKVLRIIKVAGTVQEHRINIEKIGKPAKDGFTKTKQVQYWAFHDIVGDKKRFLIRVIVRQVGDGKIHFWSVMPQGKIARQKLYQEGIDDE